MTFSGLVIGLISAVVGWLAVEFVGRPFRRFFDLRAETARRLVQFGNVFARSRMLDDYKREAIKLNQLQEARLLEAENTFRDLASQMTAFAQGETFAVWVVKFLGFDTFAVAKALLGYSNEIGIAGPNRERFKSEIIKQLRISPDGAP
jgi:hypothetical protein